MEEEHQGIASRRLGSGTGQNLKDELEPKWLQIQNWLLRAFKYHTKAPGLTTQNLPKTTPRKTRGRGESYFGRVY